MGRIFVDREKELKLLNSLLSARINGGNYTVLIYGLRRVGKTRLIEEFLREKNGILVDCSSAVTGGDFFRLLYSSLHDSKISGKCENVLRKYEGLYLRPLDDDHEMIRSTFNMINMCAANMEYLIVALDEFQGFIENMATLRIKGGNNEKSRLLWFLRNLIQKLNEKVFLVVLTSAGYIFEEYGKADSAFLQLFQKIEITPLNERDSMELARLLLKGLGVEKCSMEALRAIAMFSGGIPKLIEAITGNLGTKRKITTPDIIDTVKSMLDSGEFDDFFYAYLSFLSATTRWSIPTMVKILRSIAEGMNSPKEISKETGIKYYTLLNILHDFRKKDILDSKNHLKYPLLKEWLLSRKLPPRGRKRVDLLHQSFGITLECYTRELFSNITRRVVISDDTLFLGTTERLELGPISEVYTENEHDLIAIQKDGQKIAAEIKLGKITKNELQKFYQRTINIQNVKLRLVIASSTDYNALAEMVKKGIVFLHVKGLNTIAKKIGYRKLSILNFL